MKLSTKYFSFRNRLVVIVVGVTLGAVSLLYTNNMAQRLKWKEQHDVALWAHAIERVSRDVLGGTIQDPLVTDIMSNGNNIPFIITPTRTSKSSTRTSFRTRSSTIPTGCGSRSTSSPRRTPRSR